jgi:hypothetical protein
MITFYNHLHAQHQGRLEMLRGELVPCFEVPARADHVRARTTRSAQRNNGCRVAVRHLS